MANLRRKQYRFRRFSKLVYEPAGLRRDYDDGAVEIYERDFGKGKKVITRVIRVVEKTPTVEATERPKHDDGHTHEDGEEH